ncbi:PQQ-dependent catabolism-associated beta-propeller protein [Polaromonas sp.]|uniref:PQQ-dependent catabolism-associated beta-propeller protein n=1 Tax=Polaromonas sp. TaxID=1869339 RepID=UPI003BB4CEA1
MNFLYRDSRSTRAAPRACRARPWMRQLAAGLVTLCAGLAMAQSPAGRVYVSSEKDSRIYVFDVKGERLSSIEVCKRPRHMMFNARHTRIYVSCGDSNQLGIVETASGKMTDQIPVGDSPEIFDLSPDGKTAYVSIEDDNVMGAYNLETKAKLFEVKTGGEPEGILVMPDGKHAYVTSEVANVVHLVDIAQRKVLKNIRVGKRPRRFVLAAGGKELWISNELGASVSVLNTEDQSVKSTVEFKVQGMRASDITPVGMTLSPDGKTVWVGLGRANHVAEVDVATRQVRRNILVGKRPWGLAQHPDGKTLYVANGLSDDMTLIDTATGQALRTVAVGRVPHSVLVQP